MPEFSLTTALSAAVLTSLLLFSGNALSENLQVITDDGREVLLKEDGRWQYRSTDRFAETGDGRRVRLKEDGSWSYSGYKPLQSKTRVRTAELDIKLQKVVIETYKKKVQKNARVKTQTVFYIHINNTQQAKTDIDIEKHDISLITVKDNNGTNYPVLSIKADVTNLDYGKGITVLIRAEKSPSIFDDVDSMKIILKPQIFGLQKSITLSQKTTDFKKEDVDGFK